MLDLAPPFEHAAAIFPTWQPEGTEQLLLKPSVGKSAFPLILSAVPCTRRVEFEAVVQHPTWNVAGPLGVVLNASADKIAYLFVLEVLEPVSQKNAEARQLTLAQAVSQDLPVTMSIYRGGARDKQWLAQKQVPMAALLSAPDKTLRMRAVRNGSRLHFHCNDAKVEFEDVMPLTSKQAGYFALYLPAEVHVVSLRGRAGPTSATPSPLDEADDLHAGANFATAIAKYEAVIQGTEDDDIRREGLYKQAICHLKQGEQADQAQREIDRAAAADALTKLTRGPQPDTKDNADRWQVLAMCQLWALRLMQGKEGEGDAILSNLQALARDLPRADFQKLLQLVPAHVYQEILPHYRWRPVGTSLIAPQQRGIRDLEIALEVELLFQSAPGPQLRARFLLLRAQIAAAQKQRAHEQAAVILKEAPAPDLANRSWWFDFWDEYSLLLRQDKQPERALAEIDKRLFSNSVLRMECLPLLVERACLNARLGRAEQAEKDLDDFLPKSGDFPVRFRTRACLMRGLLLQARGDMPSAVKVWRMGLVKKAEKAADGEDRLTPLLHQLILAHLCDEPSTDEVEALRDLVLVALGGHEAQAFSGTLRNLMPELAPEQLGPVLRKGFDSTDGKRFIRGVADHDFTYPEMFEGTVVLLFVNMVKRMLEPHRLSAEEDALLKKLTGDLHGGALTGKITRQQFMKAGPSLFFLWNDQQTLAMLASGGKGGFDPPAQAFEPAVRGPIAYVFGLRYLHVFRKPRDAAEYFRRAVDLAADGSASKPWPPPKLPSSRRK